eukprot:Nk52_evm7s172 gene=Nk52_evmTU7s172
MFCQKIDFIAGFCHQGTISKRWLRIIQERAKDQLARSEEDGRPNKRLTVSEKVPPEYVKDFVTEVLGEEMCLPPSLSFLYTEHFNGIWDYVTFLEGLWVYGNDDFEGWPFEEPDPAGQDSWILEFVKDSLIIDVGSHADYNILNLFAYKSMGQLLLSGDPRPDWHQEQFPLESITEGVFLLMSWENGMILLEHDRFVDAFEYFVNHYHPFYFNETEGRNTFLDQ